MHLTSLILPVLTFLLSPVQAVKLSYLLHVSIGKAAPDCKDASVFMINNQFTGPKIEAAVGDVLEVTVSNQLSNTSITIHFHGIKQIHSPFYDGAAGFTNDLIRPGETFTYIMNITEKDYGTHMYHAHSGMSDLHIYGPLIVYDNKKDSLIKYDEERVVVLSEYFHRSPEALEKGLLSDPTKWIGDAQSLLHNGKTVSANCTESSYSFETIPVEAGKTYRFRLVGALSLNYLHWRLQNHNMKLVEMDGTLIEPLDIDHVEIMGGQRYSVLITMDQPVNDYWMRSQVRWRPTGPQNGFAVLRYKGFSPQAVYTLKEAPSNLTLPLESLDWVFPFATSLDPNRKIPNTTRTIILDGQQQKYGSVLKWTINNISFAAPESSGNILTHFYQNKIQDLPDSARPIIINKGEVVDIIIQNRVTTTGVCEVHPWHLHGHKFWDLSSGEGRYNESTASQYLFTNPIQRDTTTVMAYSGQKKKGIPQDFCGWRRVRFIADNPGVTAFHCHIASHLVMGMAVAFLEAPEDIPPLPDASVYGKPTIPPGSRVFASSTLGNHELDPQSIIEE